MSTDSKLKRRAEVHHGHDYSAVLWSDHEWTENYIARLHDDQHKNHAETLAAAINASIDLKDDGFDAIEAIAACADIAKALKRIRGWAETEDTNGLREILISDLCYDLLKKIKGKA